MGAKLLQRYEVTRHTGRNCSMQHAACGIYWKCKMNICEDYIYVDEEGRIYRLNEYGEPDFDDPIITLEEWLTKNGFPENRAMKIKEYISSAQGRRS